MKAVRVARDHWNFEYEDGSGFVSPIGGNMLNDEHPGDGTFFSHFDASNVDRRLGIMAEHGLNCLRQAIGVNEVYDAKSGLKAEGLKNWDTFIGLCEKHGVYLQPVGGYIGGNDWFEVERLADDGVPLDESCGFWEAFCGHYRNHPAIWAWDLRNELLFDTKPHMTTPNQDAAERKIREMLLADWPQWLETKYETLERLNKQYGSDYASFADVPGSVHWFEAPWDPRAYDARLYINRRGYDWCKRQCDVIRSVSPQHMICSGNNGWLTPDADPWQANGFYNIEVENLFDFVTFHPYPCWQCMPDGRGDPLDGGRPLEYWLNACIGMARLDFYNKPIVVQEYGWYGGGTSRFLCELPYRSEEEHANYTKALTDAVGPHVNGFINWPLMDMPDSVDISNHGGIFTKDGDTKALTSVYSDLAQNYSGRQHRRPSPDVVLNYSLEGLYTCRSYQDRFWDDVDATLVSGKIPDIRFIR